MILRLSKSIESENRLLEEVLKECMETGIKNICFKLLSQQVNQKARNETKAIKTVTVIWKSDLN